MAVLDIKPKEECRWDLVSLGEIMLRLDPGDGVLLLTSGCLNALSSAGERYGRARVEAFARANADRAPDEFAGALAADIERFRAGADRTADGGIAFVKRKTAA